MFGVLIGNIFYAYPRFLTCCLLSYFFRVDFKFNQSKIQLILISLIRFRCLVILKNIFVLNYVNSTFIGVLMRTIIYIVVPYGATGLFVGFKIE